MTDTSAQEASPTEIQALAGSRKRKRGPRNTLPSRTGGTYERQKASKACLVCRARKTKCDNVRPICGFCEKTGGECQYSSPPSLRYDQASLAILDQLSNLEALIKPLHVSQCCGISGLKKISTIGVSETGAPEHAHHDVSSRRQLGKPHDGLATASQTDSPPSSATLMKASSDMRMETLLQWPPFKSRLSHLTKNTMMEDLGQSPSPTASEVVNLDFDTVNQLVGNFLVNNFPSNPILDPESLRKDSQEVAQWGLRWDGTSCLVLLVLAIGSISTSIADRPSNQHIHVSRNDHAFAAAEAYFQASQRRIGSLLCENSVLSSQCAFFTAVYLSYTTRILAAWKYFVQAGTQCLGYLASRGIMEFGTKTNGPRERFDAESPSSSPGLALRVLEESLYWVILKGEAELCLELGLPGSGLNENPYPHTFPSPPNLDETAPSPGTLLDQSKENDRRNLISGWFYYLGEIALRRLQNRVFMHRYGGQSQDPADLSSSVAQFDNQLEQWMKSLPLPLQFSPTSTESLDDQLRWVLCGHRVDVIELLRFPAIRSILAPEPVTGVASPSSLHRHSADTLRLAREYLKNAVQRIEISAEGFLHRHQGSWLTIRGCTRSALVLLGAKLKCQDDVNQRGIWSSTRVSGGESAIPDDSFLPPRWKSAVLQVLDMLRVWEAESKDVGKLRVIVETLLESCQDD